ncbi:glycosyl transferase 8 family protein [Clostridium argentinense CDC 2741]|uniref:Glycosyl transferase 8 family protein n=1 Tax=Clostridium argentinense CDC 2741 TaxID=1418104 RepID=A0A0C1U0T3_9CLOT|nr:glycosyltransferase family 8 protein [Clostridium argentinense]ARC85976.1 glycosyl transferase family 8 [Clostridium argentinense]KIE46449.1 glycosyl transferase 8 family protein [Clostridium argentinense CDC 2741]NFF38910.1 glycosyltransferase family 8 protein [Clostridium argentinense]NFP48702.1 glycosyltransferase family 8 protein [Clostridium argentinense]NFP71030.1 glycosyltransferase family 8 protein [Clostridium argentinense]
MNILVTLNSNYIEQLIIMIYSILKSNPNVNFNVYIAHKELTEDDFSYIERYLDKKRCKIISVKVTDKVLKDAPVTKRYPREMYFRIFAAQFLPKDLDRILYLDPDLVVINPLNELYYMDFEDNYYIAASHVRKTMQKLNRFRLDMDENAYYINSGVMLMNLKLLREKQNIDSVFEYIEKNKNLLLLPDQDVLSALYGGKTKVVESLIYNLSDRYLKVHNMNFRNLDKRIDLDWVRENSVIMHYCGKNKPWKNNYFGELDIFYKEYAQMVAEIGKNITEDITESILENNTEDVQKKG